ncbi:sugar kinase [Oceanibium sediminis]|uniref:sugar kinase n=1 Tax=Oceanibium sediminis TaxID=2026339 RepID=UPI001E28673B|nr:sugar kinase [Oceanibium sediminis]
MTYSDDKTPASARDGYAHIACLGEVMIELSPLTQDTVRVGVAGDTFNTAVYLRRALDSAGAKVSYVTALGDEAMSERILESLAEEGLSTGLIERRAGMSPGLYMITLDSQGERSFSYWRSAAAARTVFQRPAQVPMEAMGDVDLLYLSGISIAILPQDTRDALCDWIDGFRANGGKLAFDSNYRPRLWPDAETARRDTMKMWSRCDIALPSLDDEMDLFGDVDETAVMDRLARAGVHYGALKRGPSGPRALDGSGAALSVAPVTGVVDTTAAGDSFNAGFLAAHAAGGTIAECMEAGHALSARVICHRGAIIPRPSGG